MKRRTLVTITAAIITTAAIILTAGLSLLHGAAFEEATADEIPMDVNTEVVDVPTDDEAADAVEPTVPEAAPDNGAEPVPGIIVPETEAESLPEAEPEEEQPLVKPDNISYDDDVIIQIYEHDTGKLVGQVEYTEDIVYKTIEQEHLEIFGFYNSNFAECVYDPTAQVGQSENPICIPYGKYRIEVYAVWYADNNGAGILEFAYTYGDKNLLEWHADGMLYSGCEDFIEYVDSLIAEEMAKIEAGNPDIPTREEDITTILGFGKYFNGTSFNWTGDLHAIYNRGTPRFPYIIED